MKHILHNIKDIFVDAFGITDVNNQHSILDQLMYIIDKVQTDDIETNDKLMQWLEKKLEYKVLARVSREIANKQVDISILVK